MYVDDFDCNANLVTTEADLLARLRTVRRGLYGAFFLYHEHPHPMLSVQFNGDVAYLHFFPSDDHPGYQPCRMTPDGCDGDVHFLQTNGTEADSFDMPNDTLVSADDAYVAAAEFFRSADLPPSVSWFEL
jgi:hypothetical protein